MVHSQKLWVITHNWPQEPPTAPKAVSSDHRAACMVEATATLYARSEASSGCGSFVQIQCIVSHASLMKSRAFIMHCCSCHTHRDGRERAAWQCWQAERGGQRSATLVKVADRVLVLTCVPAGRLLSSEPTGLFSRQTPAEESSLSACGLCAEFLEPTRPSTVGNQIPALAAMH